MEQNPYKIGNFDSAVPFSRRFEPQSGAPARDFARKRPFCRGVKNNKRWIWIALLRSPRRIVAYTIGDRSETTCQRLWERIPTRYRRLQTFSDFWEAYQKVAPPEQPQAVGKETGQTAHVERWNNTLRQRVGRFVRKTLSFSKSETFHEIALKIFVFHYNQQRLALISQT